MRLLTLLFIGLALLQPVRATVYFSTVGWSQYDEGALDQSLSIDWDVFAHDKPNRVMIDDGQAVWGDDTKFTFYHDLGTVLGEGESLFYAMKVTVTGGNGVHTFAGFRESSSTVSFYGRTMLDAVGQPDYRIGVSNSEAIETGWDTSTTGQQYGTEYTIVVGYDYDTGLSSLWIDPVNESSTKIVTGGAPSAAGKNLDEFVFLSGSGDGSVHAVSALAIASSFSEAHGAIAVPEPAHYAMLLGAGALVFLVGRRKRSRR